MSCRWSCRSRLRATIDRLAGACPESLPVLTELARTSRRDDFRWLAQSQGVPAEDVEMLWDGLLAPDGADPVSAARA
jgi:hypothetical protein